MRFGKCHYIRFGENHQTDLMLVTKCESVTIFSYKFTLSVKGFKKTDCVGIENNFCPEEHYNYVNAVETKF